MSELPDQEPQTGQPLRTAVTDDSAPAEQHKQRNARGFRERGRTWSLVVLAVLITVFAVLNVRDVKVNWIFGSGQAPLIVVIVISLLVGIVITYIAERRSGRRGG